MLGSCWDHVGIVLGSFWDRFGTALGPFWAHFGDLPSLEEPCKVVHDRIAQRAEPKKDAENKGAALKGQEFKGTASSPHKRPGLGNVS